MPDPRVEAYARLLVEDCLNIEPGAQVLLAATVAARPLVDEVTRRLARKGAYVIPRITFSGVAGAHDLPWIQEVPLEVLAELGPPTAGCSRRSMPSSRSWRPRTRARRPRSPPSACSCSRRPARTSRSG